MDENRYVLATKRLMEGKQKVGYMYRDEPERGDSGWRFFCGDEDQGYTDNAGNILLTDIETIFGIDEDIRTLLDAPSGTAYERGSDATIRETSMYATGRPHVSNETRGAVHFDIGLAFKLYFGKLNAYFMRECGSLPVTVYTETNNPALYVSEKDEEGWAEWQPIRQSETINFDEIEKNLGFLLRDELKSFYSTYLFLDMEGEIGNAILSFRHIDKTGDVPKMVESHYEKAQTPFPDSQIFSIGSAIIDDEDTYGIYYDNETGKTFCHDYEMDEVFSLYGSLAWTIGEMEAFG